MSLEYPGDPRVSLSEVSDNCTHDKKKHEKCFRAFKTSLTPFIMQEGVVSTVVGAIKYSEWLWPSMERIGALFSVCCVVCFVKSQLESTGVTKRTTQIAPQQVVFDSDRDCGVGKVSRAPHNDGLG